MDTGEDGLRGLPVASHVTREPIKGRENAMIQNPRIMGRTVKAKVSKSVNVSCSDADWVRH